MSELAFIDEFDNCLNEIRNNISKLGLNPTDYSRLNTLIGKCAELKPFIINIFWVLRSGNDLSKNLAIKWAKILNLNIPAVVTLENTIKNKEGKNEEKSSKNQESEKSSGVERQKEEQDKNQKIEESTMVKTINAFEEDDDFVLPKNNNSTKDVSQHYFVESTDVGVEISPDEIDELLKDLETEEDPNDNVITNNILENPTEVNGKRKRGRPKKTDTADKTTQVQQKRRGRPPKKKPALVMATPTEMFSSEISGNAQEDTAPRRRGRPPSPEKINQYSFTDEQIQLLKDIAFNTQNYDFDGRNWRGFKNYLPDIIKTKSCSVFLYKKLVNLLQSGNDMAKNLLNYFKH